MPQDPSTPPLNQTDLAAQAQAHGRLFFRLAFNILRNTAQAEDACQQAFLKAWQQRARIKHAGALRAWLIQTVVHEALQVLRRHKTEGYFLSQRTLEAPLTTAAAGEQWAQREEVLAAVARLPEPVRTVVVLRIIDGLSGQQVKEILGCSATEVSRRLHEGMELLRQALAAQPVMIGEV